jgi:hypothetical protein
MSQRLYALRGVAAMTVSAINADFAVGTGEMDLYDFGGAAFGLRVTSHAVVMIEPERFGFPRW